MVEASTVAALVVIEPELVPGRVGDEVTHGLVERPAAPRVELGGHGLQALALTGKQQPGEVRPEGLVSVGVAAGRFGDDPDTETLAIFGHSHEVELLVKRAGKWSVETILTDRDKGHALVAVDLDGRNATDELVLSGHGGRIVLLRRPVGYGRSELVRPQR